MGLADIIDSVIVTGDRIGPRQYHHIEGDIEIADAQTVNSRYESASIGHTNLPASVDFVFPFGFLVAIDDSDIGRYANR